LNNVLKWDGTHLGSYVGVITQRWIGEGMTYNGITLPDGWGEEDRNRGGIIYCMMTMTKDTFPCIVEDIKSIFGIARRGIHRINIDNKEYLIYYVPMTVDGKIIWETPLNRIENKHPLRSNVKFRREIQKMIVMCDILALTGTGEASIRIRPGVNNEFIPISVNEKATTINKETSYDFSVITKTIFLKWFGETTSVNEIAKELLDNSVKRYGMITEDNMVIITSEIRSNIEKIIEKYDVNYIWYSYFIIERISRYILAEL